jgi:hypothetical protein
MAKDDLVGNIPSELAFPWLAKQENIDWVNNIDWVTLSQQAIRIYQAES